MQDKLASLTDEMIQIIVHKGTERPLTGEYYDFEGQGSYLCKRCGLTLYRASSKFHSGCGWPSFDEAIEVAIKHLPDQDGKRIETVCDRCNAHIGHVFLGEGFTKKNTRHCVNSLSLDFVADETVLDTQECIFAAGCFWGVEYYFKKHPGVLKTEVGYIGGTTKYPTYESVCREHTGHYEAIRVIYDPQKTHFQALLQFFFEIHDFTQTNGQGPDLGAQYLSVAFYYDEYQKTVIEKVIQILREGGFKVATQVKAVTPFYRAEDYHQNYYAKTGKQPYCHVYRQIFKSK